MYLMVKVFDNSLMLWCGKAEYNESFDVWKCISVYY